MAIGDVISRLSVALNLETAAFDKGARQASGTVGKLQAGLSKFGGALAGAFASVGVIEGIKAFTDASRQALDAVGGLGEAAAAVGVGTDALQEFRYAATQVGLSTEQMDGILGQFSKRLGEGLITGKGKFVAGLTEIGVSLDELKGKTTTEQFAIIAEGMKSVGSEAERSALLTQFFGKAGQAAATLMADGAAGIRQYAEDARKLGVVATEAQIAQADAAADQIAALERVAETQRNLVLTTPEATEATLQYAKGMAELQLAATKAFSAFVQGASNNDAVMKRWRAGFMDALQGIADSINGFFKRSHEFFANMINVGRDIVRGLAQGIRNSAGEALQAAKDLAGKLPEWVRRILGIRSPSRVFMEIGDYIGQGLAIGIEGGQGKVAAATRKLTESARRAAEETQALFARLFPEEVAAKNYRDDLKRIEASGLTKDAQTEARIRLGREFTGTDGDVPIRVLDEDQALDVTKGLDVVLEKLDTFGKRARATTVQVAKSFQDMAQQTISSLQNLANSIKGGSFLDILSSVIGLGLQLGGIGAFGKKIADRINTPSTVPRYAMGTNFHPGGLAIVGERGPELVHMPRGSAVTPNHKMGGGVVININAKDAVLTQQVRQWIAEGVAIAIDKGGDVGVARVGYRQRRRVA